MSTVTDNTASINTNDITYNFVANLRHQVTQHSLIFLIGEREHDRIQVTKSDAPRTIPRVCHDYLNAAATYVYEPSTLTITLQNQHENVTLSGQLPTQIGVSDTVEFNQLIPNLESLKVSSNPQQGNTPKRVHLIINGTYFFESPSNAIGTDFTSMSALEGFARRSPQNICIFFRCSDVQCIPSKLLSFPYIGDVYIPATSLDERAAYLTKVSQSKRIAQRCGKSLNELTNIIAKKTDELTLVQLTKLVNACEKQNVASQHVLEESIIAIKQGVAENPWASTGMRDLVRTLPKYLKTQIIGQDEVIEAVTQPLIDASIGLTDSHRPNSQAPRAKLLFAGATGTGKTETCKAIARHIFGEERILRFDCGEFAQEHTSARLVGSPPGYVGHGEGGELIEGIKRNPNSLVLFDEIEKAHPQIWSIFLSILDDGCVTSGQGEKVYLNNCILVFTTNLGSTKAGLNLEGNPVRVRSFDSKTPYPQIKQTVTDAISEYFTGVLSKPELEGRFGGKKKFVVFDIIRNWEGILDKYIRSGINRINQLYGYDVTVSERVKAETLHRLYQDENALQLGGRGLAEYYKECIESVVSNYIFQNNLVANQSLIVDVDGGDNIVIKQR